MAIPFLLILTQRLTPKPHWYSYLIQYINTMKTTITSLLLALATLVSCGTKTESIKISGSTTVLPAVSVASEIYRAKNPDISIIVNAGGSGVGINQLGEGKIDLGMASRDISQSEKDQFPNAMFKEISIGKDAVVPVISSEIFEAGITALRLSDIGAIYTGAIQNWKELGGPDKEILVIDKEASRGTRHVFMKNVLGDKKAKAPGADLILGSNNEEQTALSQSDAAIGMLSHAWLNEEVKGLHIIIENDTIAPTLDNIRNGSFPITRDLNIITSGEPSKAVNQFVAFLLSPEGQQIVEDQGYVKITD